MVIEEKNVMIVLENFRIFDEDREDFPRDKDGLHTKCDECGDLSEQYMVIESKTFCKGCLENAIQRLDKNFLVHCRDSWDRRVKECHGRI